MRCAPDTPATSSRPQCRHQAIAFTLLCLGCVPWIAAGNTPEPKSPGAIAKNVPSHVIARGRIEPQTRARRISGPSTGGTLAELRVSEGDIVSAGAVLAVLDTHAREAAAVTVAEQELKQASLELDQVKSGAKLSEVAAQKALVATRRAEAERAKRQLERSTGLAKKQFLSSDALEQQQLEVNRAKESVRQAEAQLVALDEVRLVDVRVAEGRIEQARARLAQAQANLELTQVRAPIDGTILAIHARPGAALGAEGVLSLGDMKHLITIAEVDENDVALLAAGQPASVTLRNRETVLRGRVSKIYAQVWRNEQPTTDVLRGRDARIVEVEIAFESGQSVPLISGLEVTVSIDVTGTGDKR
jgi:HlyD family secretion protein